MVTKTGTPPESSKSDKTGKGSHSRTNSSGATEEKSTEDAVPSSKRQASNSNDGSADDEASSDEVKHAKTSSSKDKDDDDTVVGPLNLGAFIGICVGAFEHYVGLNECPKLRRDFDGRSGGVVLVALVIVCFVLRRRGRKIAESSEAEYCTCPFSFVGCFVLRSVLKIIQGRTGKGTLKVTRFMGLVTMRGKKSTNGMLATRMKTASRL